MFACILSFNHRCFRCIERNGRCKTKCTSHKSARGRLCVNHQQVTHGHKGEEGEEETGSNEEEEEKEEKEEETEEEDQDDEWKEDEEKILEKGEKN